MGGTESVTQVSSLGVDALGNVYTTGGFHGTVDFDPGPGTYSLTSVGNKTITEEDIFISKLDSSGSFVWAKSIGNPEGNTSSASIAVDNSGNVFITGSFSGTVDFDPGPGI